MKSIYVALGVLVLGVVLWYNRTNLEAIFLRAKEEDAEKQNLDKIANLEVFCREEVRKLKGQINNIKRSLHESLTKKNELKIEIEDEQNEFVTINQQAQKIGAAVAAATNLTAGSADADGATLVSIADRDMSVKQAKQALRRTARQVHRSRKTIQWKEDRVKRLEEHCERVNDQLFAWQNKVDELEFRIEDLKLLKDELKFNETLLSFSKVLGEGGLSITDDPESKIKELDGLLKEYLKKAKAEIATIEELAKNPALNPIDLDDEARAEVDNLVKQYITNTGTE